MPSEVVQPTVFLSYAHGDQTRARRLAHALEQAGHNIWWDELIEGGTRYARSIDEALEKADAVLVLWSQTSVQSDWVRDEAAQGRDRQRLVPVSLDGTPPPLGFRQYQSIDLSHWRGRPDAPQIDAIRRAVASATGQTPKAESPGARRLTRRTLMISGAAAATAAASGVALVTWRSGFFGSSAPRSIAVLPFKNLSGDSSQAYLSDGLTEEVRSALMRNLGLMVLADTSSSVVDGEAGDARAIAGKLGVTYLLSGSVQRAGDRVRVATELTNGRTGFSEWSQQVDRRLDDIFAFQTEIARSISNALSVRMATDAPATGGTRNVAAYEAYLRGRALYHLAKDEETDRQAKANYELAIAADPNFALAHAGLARVLSSIAASEASASEVKPLFDSAVAEARRSTELAPTLPQGHLALGYALFAGRLDVRGARPSYEAAYRYGRGDADIVLLYALYIVRLRRFEQARTAIERALALDPLNPRTWRAAGTIALASSDLRQAVTRYDRALQLNPAISNARALKAYALIGLGQYQAARKALDDEHGAMFRLTGLAILGHKTNDRRLAETSFAELVASEGDAALYQQAQVLSQWGRSNDALDRLERARVVGDSGMTAMITDPFLAPLAKNSRYRALARVIGLA